MAAKWPTLSLRDAGVALIDCDHRTPLATREGYPYIAIPQLREGRLDLSDARRISREDFDEWTRKAKPTHNDVVLSRRCNPGETATVPPGLEAALGQNLVLLRADGTQVLPSFLRWLVRGAEWWAQIDKFINVGAVFDSLRCADVPKFELTIPPLDDQREIARVLGAVDDKIELNRRMSETLVSMARAIFKSWFIDFDPVRARMDGRDPGLPKDIADLFPSRLVTSELGEIPEGWKVDSILAEAELLSGGTPKTERPEFWGGQISWASAKDVSQAGQPFLLSTERSITEEGLAGSATQVIPAFATVVVARGATTGRMALLGSEMAMNQTCYALVSKSGHPFTLHSMMRFRISELVHAAHGSVFDTITTDTFRRTAFLLAPRSALDAFEAVVAPLFHRVLLNAQESRSLSRLRDSLLPKLISGELRVDPVRLPRHLPSPA